MNPSAPSATHPVDELVATDRYSVGYRPLIDLFESERVAWAAVPHGPVASEVEAPEDFFDTVSELGLCRTFFPRLLERVLAETRGLGVPRSIWVPSAVAAVRDLSTPSPADQRLVLMLDARHLGTAFVEALCAVERARALGWPIGLHHVTAADQVLGMLPLLAPDLVLVDPAIVEGADHTVRARLMSLLLPESERRGMVIAVDGITDPDSVLTALAMGATLGSGRLFGTAGPLPLSDPTLRGLPLPTPLAPAPPAPESAASAVDAAGEARATPFGRVSTACPTRPAARSLLLALSEHIESKLLAGNASSLLLSTFHRATGYRDDVERPRYELLADRIAWVGVCATELPARPSRGVNTWLLPTASPLADEWTIAVLTPEYATVLSARALSLEDDSEGEQMYEYAISHDRQLAITVLRDLLLLLGPVAA